MAIASPHGLSRLSLVIAGFSTIVEWYDFTLYRYFATVLSRVFFGGGYTEYEARTGHEAPGLHPGG